MDASRFSDWIAQKLLLSFHGFEPSPEVLDQLGRYPVGGVTLYRSLNIQDPAQVRALTGAIQQAAAHNRRLPLLIATDQEGGQLMAVGEGATPFPGNMALGAAGSEELARRTGEAIGRELAALGININYAPVCDVIADPHNPSVGVRSFGEDPERVACLAASLVEGLQSVGVAATAKHFPGMGDAAVDPHIANPLISHSASRLKQVELPPFQAAVRTGVKLVMAGHMLLPALSEREDLPVLFSPAVLRGLLRQEMGFEGLVVSDALDMGPVARGAGLAIDSIAAVGAGVDLLLFGPGSEGQEAVLEGLVQAARRGLLDARELEASAGRVLSLKRWLANREQPPLETVGCADHQALALEIARRAVTLVRDANQQLPLRLAPDQRLLAVLPKPADLTPADTSSYERLSLAETIRRYHPATDELFISIDPTPAEIAAVREQAQDYALVIAGTINALDHERQADLIGTLMETGVPTLVIALRAPFDLLRFPQVPFYACTYSLQPPALQALVEALWGEIPWQGKLPVSLPGASV